MTWRSLLILIILFTGVVLRAPVLNLAPVEYWTVRQYPSLIYARNIYRIAESTSIEATDMPRSGGVEFPIREWIVSIVYRLLDGEKYWPLTVLSLLGWCIGVYFTYRLATLWYGHRAGLFGSAFMMFFPYGYLASVGIMPDVLMTGLLVAALWSIQCFDTSASKKWFFISALVSALAIFIKPGVTQFAICLAYFFVVHRKEGWRCIAHLRHYGWAFMVLAPAMLCLALNAWWGPDWISRILFPTLSWDSLVRYNPVSGQKLHVIHNIQPEYLFSWRFWKAWAGHFVLMFGVTGSLAALAGLLMAAKTRIPPVLAGYAIGYVLQCCFTTWTTIAHDYWHLQAVPLIALGAGYFLDAVWTRWIRFTGVRGRYAAGLAILAIFGGMAWSGVSHAIRLPDQGWYIEACRAVGSAVGHSRNCMIMDYDSGFSLRYFADIGGQGWPESEVISRFRRDGLPIMTGWEDKTMLEKLADRERLHGAPFEYFVIMRQLKELNLQPDLKSFLDQMPVVAEGERYKVWRLGGD